MEAFKDSWFFQQFLMHNEEFKPWLPSQIHQSSRDNYITENYFSCGSCIQPQNLTLSGKILKSEDGSLSSTKLPLQLKAPDDKDPFKQVTRVGMVGVPVTATNNAGGGCVASNTQKNIPFNFEQPYQSHQYLKQLGYGSPNRSLSGDFSAQSYGRRYYESSDVPAATFQEVPLVSPKKMICNFCRQNGDRREFYSDHELKDSDGNIICPVLSCHKCEICGATGTKAHTKSYCPVLKSVGIKPRNAVSLKKTLHDSSGRVRK